MAESALRKACEEEKLPFTPAKDEAAFYGPKLDFMFKDAIGREWQLATIQCDFNLPERFDLSFTNEKGEKERPVVIHRAISGSLERFMGVMIEHYAGVFPLWLSPVQVKIVPIGDNELTYAKDLEKKLTEANVRVELDNGGDSFGKRIRNAKVEKVPYIAVIGKKEVEEGKVTLEGRNEKFELSLAGTIEKLTSEIKAKS